VVDWHLLDDFDFRHVVADAVNDVFELFAELELVVSLETVWVLWVILGRSG
jgi:hypothetical protein